MLAAEGLVAGYVPEVDILTGVSIRVAEGEIVTVIGPNGAGKSTLIKTIFGLLQPREGRVVFRGEDIAGAAAPRITRRGMSYVPQLDNVFEPHASRRTSRWARSTPRTHGQQMERDVRALPAARASGARRPPGR